jgi:ABC-type glycerol-3-phosphate transport system permease component
MPRRGQRLLERALRPGKSPTSSLSSGIRDPAVLRRGGLRAGALLAAAPPVILYAFLMDYYIAGLISGATES